MVEVKQNIIYTRLIFGPSSLPHRPEISVSQKFYFFSAQGDLPPAFNKKKTQAQKQNTLD